MSKLIYTPGLRAGGNARLRRLFEAERKRQQEEPIKVPRVTSAK